MLTKLVYVVGIHVYVYVFVYTLSSNIKRNKINTTVKPTQAVTCIKRSLFSSPVIENFIRI